jgi:hypothetical protein
VEGVDDRVDLDAVAGRQHHHLGDVAAAHHLVEQLGDLVSRYGGPLQQLDRRAAVRQAHHENVHEITCLSSRAFGEQRRSGSGDEDEADRVADLVLQPADRLGGVREREVLRDRRGEVETAVGGQPHQLVDALRSAAVVSAHLLAQVVEGQALADGQRPGGCRAG